jgi:hypothetical protein
VRMKSAEFSPEKVRTLSEPARRIEVLYDIDLFDASKTCIGRIVRVDTTNRLSLWRRNPLRRSSLRADDNALRCRTMFLKDLVVRCFNPARGR